MSTRICIVGCGAIGGLYAAHLAQLDGVEVWAYDVSAEHVVAINAHGLRLTGHVALTAEVHARVDPDGIPACSFGIVATKGTFTRAAIEATQRVFADGAVCSVQNGIGNEEVIAEYVPRVIRGVTLPAGRVTEPGVVRMYGGGTTWIGPFEPRPATMAEVRELGALCHRSGMETVALDDARPPQWTKLLFNCATNPLCALTGLTHGEMWDVAAMHDLVSGLVDEGLRVADALGITPDGDPKALIAELAHVNYDHQPSMLQDVLAHRRTEIATLNGGIVQAGAACGVPTPLNQAIAALIAGLELSWGGATGT
ncbi:MAG TPA: 2-dehydropantoate 2-reductase [Solirubrobacteraceae bacterium]|nr:2-dehydropantoate 2-reductase [Solirubrobacteraceae bacterium]